MPIKFQVICWNTFWVRLRTKFKYNKNENEQRAIIPKVWSFKLWFLSTALLFNEIYLPVKFQVSSLNTFWVMLLVKFKNENEQRAITPKVLSFELFILCAALLLNEIYLPMKFRVDAMHSFKVMLRTKKGRTEWLVHYYMPPFGDIIKTTPTCFELNVFQNQSIQVCNKHRLMWIFFL